MPVRTMYIDVDNTLVDDNCDIFGGVEDKLEQWQRKYDLICWSHTGGEYAKKVCIKNNIDKYFKLFLDKPDVIVDDKPSLILDICAKIIINDPNEDWVKEDKELFSNSRDIK